MMHTDIWRAIDILAQRQAKANMAHTKGEHVTAGEVNTRTAKPKKSRS